jgi:hypothetical protein
MIKEQRDGCIIIPSFFELKVINVMPWILADFTCTIWWILRLI